MFMIFILDYKIYNPISFHCMKLEKGGFSDKYIIRSPYLFFFFFNQYGGIYFMFLLCWQWFSILSLAYFSRRQVPVDLGRKGGWLLSIKAGFGTCFLQSQHHKGVWLKRKIHNTLVFSAFPNRLFQYFMLFFYKASSTDGFGIAYCNHSCITQRNVGDIHSELKDVT